MWRVEWNWGCDQYIVAANQGRVFTVDDTLGIDILGLHLRLAHHLVIGHPI